MSLLLLVICTSVYEQTQSDLASAKDIWPLIVDYSIFDYPFAIYAGKTVNSTVSDPNADVSLFAGMGHSSMDQAMQIYTGVNRAVGWGLKPNTTV